MNYKISLIVFFIIIGSGLSAYLLVHNGLYPVTIVNFHMISAKTLEKDYDAAFRYFYNALSTYGSNPEVLQREVSQKEIRRATLNKLITDRLIYDEVKKRIGGSLDEITEKIIDQNINSAKLEQAVEKIYGLKMEDFKQQILVTQAHREILEGRMLVNKESFDDWLKNTSAQARVVILLPDFYWDGERVKTRD